MIDFETVVVGAGPAGLFAALGAARSGRVLLVDSGSTLEDRLVARRDGMDERETITRGFGGAGLFSDGKLCLSHRIGSTVSHRFSPSTVNRRQEMIDRIIRDGHEAPLWGADDSAAADLVERAASAGLEYLHYPVRHVGSDQLPVMLTGLRRRLGNGVHLLCRTACVDVRRAPDGHGWVVEVEGAARREVTSSHVVLAPGKVGASWLAELGARLELPHEPARPKLGFRLEGPRDYLDPLLAVANDPKVIWHGDRGAEARTHCVCYGGDVVPASYEDLLLVGGHSRSDHAADRSNCALIAAPGSDSPLSESLTREIVRRINRAHAGRVVRQQLGDFLAGSSVPDNGGDGAGFRPSIPDAAPGDLCELLPPAVVEILRRFVRRLAVLCPAAAAPGNLIYGPAAERWAHRFVVNDGMVPSASPRGGGSAHAHRRTTPCSARRSDLTADAAPLWTATSLNVEEQVHWVSLEDVTEILTALETAKAQYAGRDLVTYRDVRREGFPLRRFGGRLRWMAEEVSTGRGFAVLRGLPVDDLDDLDCQLLLRGLAAHLGDIATQSRDGDLIRHVRATGRALGDAAVRGHETAERLYFHTDGADAAVLLCQRAALRGGRSRLASAGSVHNRLLARNPSLAEVLYEPFHFHMAGGHVPGLPATFISPVFSHHRGLFSCRYVRHTLLETPTVTGVPLTTTALAAFDAIEELAGDGCVEMDLRAGDLQIVNNHTVLHSRTGYVDDPVRPRQLLRSWLTLPGYEGRRDSLVDEGLRFGWLSDDLQRRAARTWTEPTPPLEGVVHG